MASSEPRNNTVVAEIGAKLGLASISFTTRSEFHHYRRISIELLEIPFETFEGSWRFSAESENSSRIEFHLRFRFAHERLASLFDPLFGEATNTVIEAFKQRAQTIYGSP